MDKQQFENLKVGDKVKFVRRVDMFVYSSAKIGDIFKITEKKSKDHYENHYNMEKLKTEEQYGMTSDTGNDLKVPFYTCFEIVTSSLKEWLKGGEVVVVG